MTSQSSPATTPLNERPDASRFYVLGGTVPVSASSYVRRKADNDLLAGLLGGEYCFVLNSRQMGKSSLSVRTINALRERGRRCVFLDITRIGGQNVTPEQWYMGLLSETGRGLDLRDEFIQYGRDNSERSLPDRYFGAIREIGLERSDIPLVIFIDEIDAVRSLPFSADAFFGAMREFYNRRVFDPVAACTTFCLVGSATPAHLVEDTRTSPFGIGRQIELRDFTRSEAALLAVGMATNGRDGTLLLDRVYYWTKGHPYLTQSLCAEIAADSRLRTPTDVDRHVKNQFFEARARSQNINLANVASRIIGARNGANADNEKHRATILETYHQILKGEKVRDDESNDDLALLKLSGVTRTEQGHLLPRNRIYARVFDAEWIAAQMPLTAPHRERAASRRGMLTARAIAGIMLIVIGGLFTWAIRNSRREGEGEK